MGLQSLIWSFIGSDSEKIRCELEKYQGEIRKGLEED
jgi:hypothetical protein